MTSDSCWKPTVGAAMEMERTYSLGEDEMRATLAMSIVAALGAFAACGDDEAREAGEISETTEVTENAAASSDPVVAEPALASTPKPVEITSRGKVVTITGEAVDDGLVCSSATGEFVRWEDLDGRSLTEEEFREAASEGMQTGTITVPEIHAQFTCADGSGTFVVARHDSVSPAHFDYSGLNEDVATWVVESGTGSYENLWGEGTFDIDYSDDSRGAPVYSGLLWHDADPSSDSSGAPEPTGSSAEVAAPSRDDYIDAAARATQLPRWVDGECLSAGVVDAIGVDQLVDAGVMPDDLAEAITQTGLIIEVAPAARDDVLSAFNECVDTGPLVEETLVAAGIDLGVSAELRGDLIDCVVSSVEPAMSTMMADEFLGLDPEYDFDQLMAEYMPAAMECGAGLGPDRPDDAVTWADGPEVFTTALASRMATPIEASLPSYTLEETTCFSTDVVDLLTPQLDGRPTITVGQFADYLGALATPESIGLTIDDATAQAMAESSISCLDINRLAMAGMSAVLGVELDEEAVTAAAACLDDELGKDTMLAMQRLQYLRGSDAIAQIEFTELMEIYSPALQRCMPPP